jgi:hypothetical protein
MIEDRLAAYLPFRARAYGNHLGCRSPLRVVLAIPSQAAGWQSELPHSDPVGLARAKVLLEGGQFRRLAGLGLLSVSPFAHCTLRGTNLGQCRSIEGGTRQQARASNVLI